LQKKARIDGPLNGHRQQDLDQVDDSSDEDEEADGEYGQAPTRELSALQSEISAAVEEDRRQVRETNRTRRGAGQNVGSVSNGMSRDPVLFGIHAKDGCRTNDAGSQRSYQVCINFSIEDHTSCSHGDPDLRIDGFTWKTSCAMRGFRSILGRT
jgi:hypothetical protein